MGWVAKKPPGSAAGWSEGGPTPPSGSSAKGRERPPAGPTSATFSLLVHLWEAAGERRAVTQSDAARALGRSQPTISRALRHLETRGLVHGRSLLGADRDVRERSYSLSYSGGLVARSTVAEARALPTTDPEFSVSDLLDLHLGLSLTDVLALPFEARVPGGPALIALSSARYAERHRPAPMRGGPSRPIPALIGRWSERKELLRLLGRVLAPTGRGAVGVLLGPAGQGKTTLLQYAEAVARRRGFRVLHGQVARPRSGPYSPFEETIGTLAPETSPSDGSSSLSPAQRLLRYLRVLRESASETPLLLVVDDLHWADPGAITAFRFLCHNLPTVEEPVLLLVSARTDEPRPSSAPESFEELVGELERPGTPLATVLTLPPLSRSEAREVMDSVRGADEPALPPDVVERLLARARGNPLFLVEGMREALRATGPEGTEGTGPYGRPSVPASLRRLLMGRVAQLPPGHRRFLEACALLEEEFSPEPLEVLVAHGVPGAPSERETLLHELVDTWALLVERAPGRYAFVHPLFQEALAERLPLRRAWAEELATWESAHRPEAVDQIARLFALARRPDRALPWLSRALDQRQRERAYDATVEVVEQMRQMIDLRPALRHPHVHEELELLEELWLRGGHAAGARISRGLRAWGVPPRERIEAACFELLMSFRADRAESERTLGELRRAANSLAPDFREETRGIVEATAAFVHGWWGLKQLDFAEAGRAIDLLNRRPGCIWSLSARLSRSFCLIHLERYSEAEAMCRATAELLPRGSRTLIRGQLEEQRASIDILQGHSSPGLRRRTRAVEICRSVGNPGVLAEELSLLALVQLQRADLDAARKTLAEMREIVERFSLHYWDHVREYREGQLLLAEGRKAEALPEFHRAARGFRSGPVPAAALLPEAYLLASKRRRAAATAFWQEWHRESGRLDVEERRALGPVLREIGPPVPSGGSLGIRAVPPEGSVPSIGHPTATARPREVPLLPVRPPSRGPGRRVALDDPEKGGVRSPPGTRRRPA